MNVLVWHVHGSWTTAFVQGRHRYLVPVLPDRGPLGRGRARTWAWPSSVEEIDPDGLRDADVDAVVLQRPEEVEVVEDWLGRRPGRDVPALYVEHNTPPAPGARHPLADRRDVTIVHVTHFNALMWDTGTSPTAVVEHGVIDPGLRYTGELDRIAVVVNEPVRRGRAVGADLLPGLASRAPVDLFGMGVDGARHLLGESGRTHEDLPQATLHDALPRRRVYVHPFRWTSLGLSLIEAMLLGLPVVALATTAAPEAVPPGGGVVTADVDRLHRAVARFRSDHEAAQQAGVRGREHARRRFGVDRFLTDWDHLLEERVA